MWLMTKHGFFSIVCARASINEPQPGWPENRKPHPGLFMVRARLREHLENLHKHWPQLGPVVADRGTDYPYRIFVDRQTTVALVAWLAGGIDYTNFKDAAKDAGGAPAYLDFLHDVWAAGFAVGRGIEPARDARPAWLEDLHDEPARPKRKKPGKRQRRRRKGRRIV